MAEERLYEVERGQRDAARAPRAARADPRRPAGDRSGEAEVVKERVVARRRRGRHGGRAYWDASTTLRTELERLAADEHPPARPRDRARWTSRRTRRRRIYLCWRVGEEPSPAGIRSTPASRAGARCERARPGGGHGRDRRGPAPGIGAIADTVELAFADDVPTLASALEGTDVLFAWHARSALLAGACGSATELRWIQSASARRRQAAVPRARRRATSCSRTPAASTRTRSPSTSSG